MFFIHGFTNAIGLWLLRLADISAKTSEPSVGTDRLQPHYAFDWVVRPASLRGNLDKWSAICPRFSSHAQAHGEELSLWQWHSSSSSVCSVLRRLQKTDHKEIILIAISWPTFDPKLLWHATWAQSTVMEAIQGIGLKFTFIFLSWWQREVLM